MFLKPTHLKNLCANTHEKWRKSLNFYRVAPKTQLNAVKTRSGLLESFSRSLQTAP